MQGAPMKYAFLSAIMLLGCAATAQAADFTGNWNVAVREAGVRNYFMPMTDGRLLIDPNGSARYNNVTFTGRMEQDRLHLTCTTGGRPCGTLVLQQPGERLTGTGTLIDSDGLARPVTLEGTRPVPRRAPQSFNFEPKQFHNVFSSTIAPALHLQPGDKVSTRTVDSRGFDRDGRPYAPRSNPLTGPFYIDGAMPGDTLVVHLDRIRTNRDTAFQSNQIAGQALEPDYLRETAAAAPPGYANWRIDAAAGTATLLNPGPRLNGYSVKLAPMLGGVGVAPARDEVMRSIHLGPFGGNLDSPEVREGTTLYLPVFHPGALLFLGDGHAAQGDGELPGQGLETSMDIEFRVDLIQGRALGQPRLESADAVMIMGIGGSLDAAMRSATTHMSRWLADTYGLTQQDIASLLGTAIQFQIAEVVDPEFNVVAKISKADLAKIRK